MNGRSFAIALIWLEVSVDRAVSTMSVHLQHPLRPALLVITGQFVLILLVLAVELPRKVEWLLLAR